MKKRKLPSVYLVAVFTLFVVSLYGIDAFAREGKSLPQNPYFREDQLKREQWAREAQERRDRGEPRSRENPYFKEDRERRETWKQQDAEKRARGESLGRENRYFKEDREKRERWKEERRK